MAVPRWLVPILVALVLVSSPVMGLASALPGETACCCPKPAACKCHDLDDHPRPSHIKQCGGDAKQLGPAVSIATVPQPAVEPCKPRIEVPVTFQECVFPDDRVIEIEVPPF